MTDLVIRSTHGRISLVKDFDPHTPFEPKLATELRRIELSAREEPLDLDVLAQALEFNMLDNA